MANLKAAIKDLKQTKKRTVYNKRIKDDIKTLMKKTRKAIEAKSENAEEMVEKCCKLLDKASQKKVIRKQTVNRKKSRLQLSYNKAFNTPTEEKKEAKEPTKKTKKPAAKKTTAKEKTAKKETTTKEKK